MSFCRADPAAGPCANVFCVACRTERAFPHPEHERRTTALLTRLERVRDGTLTRAAASARSRRFAAMSPEERRLAMAKVQGGRIMKNIAHWPFPDGNRSLNTNRPKLDASIGLPKMSNADALVKARAALAAKMKRTKLARDAAKKKGDASRRRPDARP